MAPAALPPLVGRPPLPPGALGPTATPPPAAPGVPLVVPGQPGTVVAVRFTLAGRDAAYRNEFGLYFVSDAAGRVAGLAPGAAGYAAAALGGHHVLLFSAGDPVGRTATVLLPAGTAVGYYLVQDASLGQWRAANPGNGVNRGPLAFFSFAAANPDGLAHFRPLPGNAVAAEDATGGGDRDFNDVVSRADFQPVRLPVTVAAAARGGNRPTPSPAVTGAVTGGNGPVRAFLASLDGGPWRSVLPYLRGDRHFTLDRARLAALAGGRLGAGRHALRLRAADGVGDVGARAVTFTYDATPPALSAGLARDTAPGGATNGDRLTSDPTVAGTAGDGQGALRAFQAALDGGAFVDASPARLPGGGFTLGREFLDRLAGGRLADGPHVVRLRATDPAGNASVLDLPFILDTAPPAVTRFGLLEGPTAPPPGPVTTAREAGSPAGVTEPGVEVRLGGEVRVAGLDGAFAFPARPLAPGPNAFPLVLTDAAGNEGTFAGTVVRASGPGDGVAPVVAARLKVDTAPGGTTNDDRLTSDPTVVGSAADDSGRLQSFRVTIDGGPAVDLLADLGPGGGFTLDRARFAALLGAPLADGPHALRFEAVDAAGNAGAVECAFTLDTTPPAVSLGLDPASDTAPAGDLETTRPQVTLVGQAEPGVALRVGPAGPAGVAGPSGAFALPGVALAEGPNPLTVRATDAAGNEGAAALTVTRILDCEFDSRLTGWDVEEGGGSPGGRGGVTASAGQAVLREGDSFTVGLRRTFTVPGAAATLTIELGGVAFDTSASGSMRDAFEAAVLDAQGAPLVHTIGPGRDAFFNLSEGQPAALAPGVGLSGQTLTVSLAGLPAGSAFTVAFRLVNNDGDTGTEARVGCVMVTAGGGAAVPAAAGLGAAATPGGIDLAALSDLTPSVRPEYGRTSFNEDRTVVFADVALRNGAGFVGDVPLLVGVTRLSDPAVRVRGADGVTPDGVPYYDFSSLLGDGTLAAGERSGARALEFYNPGRAAFTYDLVVLGRLNRAPAFTSAPLLEALVGKGYGYDADAADADGDTLSYELLAGPAGMAIDAASGVLTWRPAAGDAGTQAVAVRVSDGRGGEAVQRFALGVLAGVPNRPPVFTSVPVVSARASAEYAYAATASDSDGGALTFSVVAGPAGLAIDPASGLVRWTPAAAQVGTAAVTLKVTDGVDAATQAYTILVDPEAGNHAPVVVSEPATAAGPGQAYRYDVDAVDADNDRLRYSLSAAPAGMTIDPDSGEVRWVTPSARPGPNLPTVSGFLIDQYATVANPMGLAFDPAGVLYVGTDNGELPLPDPNERVRRVGLGGSPVEPYGRSSIADPDALAYDAAGTISGVKGAVLVGGLDTGLGQDSSIKAILPDGTVRTVFGPTQAFLGPNVMSFDRQGRLLFTAGGPNGLTVFVSTGQFPAPLFSYRGADAFATDAAGRIYVLASDDRGTPSTADDGFKIEVHAPDGTLLNGSLVTGLPPMARDPATGFFGGDPRLAVWDDPEAGPVVYLAHNSSLYRFDAAGAGGVVGTGFRGQTSSLAFGLDGSLYVAQFNGADRVLRLVPNPRVSVRVEDGRGGSDTQTFTIDLGNRPPEIVSTPVTTAFTGAPYSYDVNAVDPDGDTLTFRLDASPAGMSIDSSTGLIEWQPSQSAAATWSSSSGTVRAEGLASDAKGNLYTAGYFTQAVTFASDQGPITFQASPNATEGYVTKRDASGNLVWARHIHAPVGVHQIASDRQGNTYVAGTTSGNSVIDLDPGPGTFLVPTAPGGGIYSAFFKLDPAGNPVWATRVPFLVHTVSVDDNGGAYLTGWGIGPVNFAPSAPDVTLAGAGGSEVVVARFSTDGLFRWARMVGGSGDDGGDAVVADPSGNVYVMGEFRGAVDFDPGPGTATLQSAGENDLFVVKLSPDGGFIWARRVGGPGPDATYGRTIGDIAVDDAGGLYLTSFFTQTVDFDPGTGQFPLTSVGAEDAFLLKLTSDGAFAWVRTIGGALEDAGRGLNVDPQGNINVTGYSLGDVTTRGFSQERSLPQGAFVLTVTPGGTLLDAQAFAGGIQPYEVVSAGSGGLAIGGEFRGPVDFDLGIGTNVIDSQGRLDGFVARVANSSSVQVSVRVEDGRGGSDTQPFTIDVRSDAPGEIRGTKFDDLNGNRRRDANEPGLAGWMIYLDSDQDGVRDAGELTTTTGADGGYVFSGLQPGQYMVREVARAGWTQTFPGDSEGTDTTAYYVDWTSADVSRGTATGVITLPGGSTVTVGLEAVFADGSRGNLFRAQTNGGTNYWVPSSPYVSAQVTNPPPGTDVLQLIGGQNQIYRVTLSEPIVDPIMAIVSLGSTSIPTTYDFDSPFAIVSQGAGYWGGTSTSLTQLPGDVLRGVEGHGTIKFLGTFSTFSWTVPTPENWHGFTFAIRSSASLARDGYHLVNLASNEVEIGKDFGNRQDLTPQENRPPLFTTTAPAAATVGQLLRYNAAAADPDGDPLTLDLVVKPAGMAVQPATGVVVWAPTADQVGSHDVTLRVRDGRGGVALQSFTVTVARLNSTPVITSTPHGPAVVGVPYAYQVRAQDADGDPITFSLDAAPAGMTIDAATGLLTWTPAPGQVGSRHVEVTAGDGRGASTTQLFDLPVVATAPNRAPSVTSTPRGTIRIGGAYLYQVVAADPDGDPLTYSLPAAPAGMSIDAAGLVSWVPAAAQLGPNAVQVRVDDGRGGFATQSFTVNVVSQTTNRPPSITSTPPGAATAGRLYAYDLAAADPDGDPVAWSLDAAPSGASLDPARGTLRWTPTADQLGAQQLVVRAVDGQGGWATQTFTVTVRAVNLPPAITSTPPTQAAANRPYSYAVAASDPDGDALSFALTAAPAGASLSPAGTISWTPTAAQVGSHAFAVRVVDGQGGFATQTFTVVVSATGNRAPVVTSTPPQAAVVGRPYEYPVTASDPDGDALLFVLLAGPDGMTIDPTSGRLTWTPAAAQVGVQTVTVGAVDPAGSGGSQTYEIAVDDGNLPPAITSSPPQTVTAGLAYGYDVRASDPDGDPLSYRLDTAPAGMTLDQLGRLRWQTGVADVGTHRVAVTVRDTHDNSVTQTFDLAVLADTQAPRIQLFVSANPVDVGTVVSFVVLATDNVGVVGLSLTVDGAAVALDANGRASVRMARPGDIPVVAAARDAAGLVSTASGFLGVIDRSDTTPPEVRITTPLDGAVLTAPTDVVGTASDANLVSYVLEVAPLGSAAFTEVFRGSASVTNGVLGRFDPTGLANDAYTLRLSATDAGGNTSVTETTVHVAGDLKVGNFTLSFTDLTVPVSGVPVTVTRTYDSLNAGSADELGYGWRLEFRDTDLRTGVEPTGMEEEGFFNAFREGTRVTLTVPGGRRESFTFRPQRLPGFGGLFPFYRPAFVADRGGTSTLSVPDGDTLMRVGNEYRTLADLPYNPADTLNFKGRFTLTTREGLIYSIDAATGDLLSMTDAGGNALSFSDAAIASNRGVRVTFDRDPQGRIVAVTDPAGNKVRYRYDARGDLVGVTDRDGRETRFVYNEPRRPHYLTEVIDPLGRAGVRTEYDGQGRLVSLIDAAGKQVRLSHDPDNSVETVFDALGRPTAFEYDARGNVVREVNALGGVTTRTYDPDNNVLTETDPLGHTTTFTYDGDGNVLTTTDPLGHVTRNTYVRFTPSLWDGIRSGGSARPISLLATTTDPLGHTTTNSYDGQGNLLSTTDAAGNVTRYTYDSAGNQTSVTDPSGKVTRFEYDGRGNLVRQTDAQSHVTTYTYDANGNQLTQSTTLTTPGGARTLVTTTEYDAGGRPTAVTDAENHTTRTEYDALGRQSATVDALGRRTRFEYDERGLLVRTLFPDGTEARSEYDAAGRRVSSTDRAGRVTRFVYDELGRLTETAYPDATPLDPADNPRTKTEYDAAGRVKAQTDERNNRTEFGFDDAGRQTLVRNALGQETTTEYDDAGRAVATTDALGHTTRFVYDDLGRQVRTVFADNSSTSRGYDELGRVVVETDQLNRSTRFEYDDLGRLTAVVDAKGQRTEYGYDEAGDLVTQRDASNRVTRYEYDGLGRRVATVLPLGQRSTTEYDAVGNVVHTTDFNGDSISYDYDTNNRLLTKAFPDGSSVTFTYTPTGQRQTYTDARGVTRWAYDERDRLLSRTDPDGTVISWAYDAAGNRTSVTTPAGTTTYTFDALNRTETVSDGAGGLTRYAYDAAGRLVRADLPNGTHETREYDDVNHLVFLENRSASGVISSYRYELADTGRRDAVVEQDGRRVDYTYDELDRLVREQITDAALGNRRIDYTYDAVGNRLTRDDSAEGLTRYAYDDNDRLLTEDLLGTVARYTYDDNGNTLSRVVNAADQAFYGWDFENRMVSADVTGASGTRRVVNAYDADGIRVVQAVGGAETRYLIDTVQPYAQVLLEYRPSGLTVVSYTYGLDLIAQNRGGAKSFYHVDGLGSTRAITNAAGAVTDRYIYDAFGRTIGQVGSTSNAYLFTGEQRDKGVGLDYLRARYYHGASGRFVSRDPFRGIPNVPSTCHPYSYAVGSPTNYRDQSGAVTLTEAVVTTVITSVLAQSSINAISSAIGARGGSSPIKWDAALLSLTVETPIATLFGGLLRARSKDCIGGNKLEASWLLIGGGRKIDIGETDSIVGIGVDVESFVTFANLAATNLSQALDGPYTIPDFNISAAGFSIELSHYELVSPRWLGLRPWVFTGGFLLAQASLLAATFTGSVSTLQIGFGSGVSVGVSVGTTGLQASASLIAGISKGSYPEWVTC